MTRPDMPAIDRRGLLAGLLGGAALVVGSTVITTPKAVAASLPELPPLHASSEGGHLQTRFRLWKKRRRRRRRRVCWVNRRRRLVCWR